MTPPLDLSNPAAVREWIAKMEEAIDGAIGVGEDQVRPWERRDLGARQARRLLREAKGTLHALIAVARAALPPPPVK